MSRNHVVFAAELREDARGLRHMANTLERRAAEHDQLAGAAVIEGDAPAGIPTAFAMNMPDAEHAAWVEKIYRRAARNRPPIDEDSCAFGLRYVGSSLAPRLEYT